jgi:hypothetical protein
MEGEMGRIKRNILKVKCKIIPGQDILISTHIGDRQMGVSAIFDEERNVKDVSTQFIDYNLGDGNTLIDKIIPIKTIVSDINEFTNRTSVSYKIKGGISTLKFKSEVDVDEDGDPANHYILIKFFK